MKLGKTSSAEEIQVIGRFESLRKILLSEEYARYLDKPLAYWRCPVIAGCPWPSSDAP